MFDYKVKSSFTFTEDYSVSPYDSYCERPDYPTLDVKNISELVSKLFVNGGDYGVEKTVQVDSLKITAPLNEELDGRLEKIVIKNEEISITLLNFYDATCNGSIGGSVHRTEGVSGVVVYAGPDLRKGKGLVVKVIDVLREHYK